MHKEAFDFVAGTLRFMPPAHYVAEFGSLNINGSPRELFSAAVSYHGIDRQEGPGVDEVADAATWEGYRGWPLDVIVCCETLEHAENASVVCYNAHERLEPGGLFIVTAAMEPRAPHSHFDGGPLREGEFYHNVDPDELGAWLSPFGHYQISVNEEHGDVYAVAWKEGGRGAESRDAA